jgi:hypothetical protein
MASAARAVMTKGDAICATPAATAVLMTVRRSSFIERISCFIFNPPMDFLSYAASFCAFVCLVDHTNV